MTPREARDLLGAALSGVDGVRYYAEYSASVIPPASKVGIPALRFETGCPEPTDALFSVFLIAAADDWGLEQLMDLVPSVVAAIEALDEAVVLSVQPTVWGFSGPELPAYELTTEVTL